MPGLDKSLLYKVMRRVEEIESDSSNLADTTDFLEFIGKPLHEAKLNDMSYIDKHLVFLEQCGYLKLSAPTYQVKRCINLTALGRIFLQPELADFTNKSFLPDIIGALEEQIQTLNYPVEERDGLLYRLRDAVAKNTPEVIAKIIIEVATLYVKAHGL